MRSQFVNHFTKPLQISRPPTPTPSPPAIQTSSNSSKKRALHALLVSFNQNQPITSDFVTDAANSLIELDSSTPLKVAAAPDAEEESLKQAIVGKLVVSLYAEALDTYLAQATQVEAEAEWWADIERSRVNVAWYLLQTLPHRVINLVQTILRTIHARGIPLHFSILTPTSLRVLFPSPDAFRPNALTTSLFPHLTHQSLSLASSAFLFPSPPDPRTLSAAKNICNRISAAVFRCFHVVAKFITLPVELTRQECRFKRKELERIRDERAEVLGRLAQFRGPLAAVVEDSNVSEEQFKDIIFMLKQTVTGDPLPSSVQSREDNENPSPLPLILRLARNTLPSLNTTHTVRLQSQHLLRPSRIVLLWPKLLLFPPLAMYTIKSLYASRATLLDLAIEAKETAEGLVRGWLIEPLRDVLKTVRAGGDEGVLVHREGVAADLDSLERMTLSLAKDELKYDSAQLAELSKQIRVGDLTPVMQLYEEDIRRPVRSVMMGTLLRSVFIQVQKAKVDIDQALAGIDKLLKSQELTFAFVGVAPALAIVYLLGGTLTRVYGGAQGRGRYGGLTRRKGVFIVMRRIERLLNQSSSPHSSRFGPQNLMAPLPTGLLLLSVTRLRQYADTSLPVHSRLREGFLEDVADLEDPELGWESKVRVVERMWRCWGGVLGWGIVAGERMSG